MEHRTREDAARARLGVVGSLGVAQLVSWGALFYAFAVIQIPMGAELGRAPAELSGAFSLALLISAAAGVGVGRWLDRHEPAPLISAGSLLGVAILIAWSQVESLGGLYAVWALMGLAMACTLYEPVAIVVAKRYGSQHGKALATLTIVAGLASFVFLPLTQQLSETLGWRDTLLVLAALLAAVTVPIHLVALRRLPIPSSISAVVKGSGDTLALRDVLRERTFWPLATAFALGMFTSAALVVHLVPALISRGHSPQFAALATGLLGLAQLPARFAFGLLAGRVRATLLAAAAFATGAVGLGILALAISGPLIVAGVVLQGTSAGTATLVRSVGFADDVAHLAVA
ncbi:MAG: MFS transporter [Actinobacteria bacterium]|nr:MFS transporter [Actinomycetota bacterium]